MVSPTFDDQSARMKALHDYYIYHKSRLAIYAMLGAATIFCMVLARVRFSEDADNRYDYLFLVRNLFLAWIPVLIALITQGVQTSRRTFFVILPFTCLIWLVFFPNAPYLLTDFQHLRLYHDSPKLWFDVILVIWFAFTGLFLGLVSLYVMQRLVRITFGSTAAWLFVLAAALLSSSGIYIGRFFRLTSWEVLRNPIQFGGDLLEQVRNSGSSSPAFVGLYTLFLLFVYLMIPVFGSLRREDGQGQQ
jgi:uncharacterized membrane protein